MKPPQIVPRPTDAELADEMLTHAAEVTKRVMEQREEILEAFVAKYGFAPDQCEQVHSGNSWFVVRLDPDTVARVTRAIIIARLGRRRFNWWRRLCFWAAGIRKPKRI